MATAQLLTRSFRATLRLSAAIGVAAVVVGLGAARAWGLAPGGTIVLTTAAAFAVVSLLLGGRRKSGPLSAGLAHLRVDRRRENR